jgi:iron-sulfur cluster insertion protein
MMNILPGAVTKLQELFAEENNPNIKLRVFVQGGGCSGFQYGFTFDEEQGEDDFDFEAGDVKVLVDSMSMQYLQGADIDYQESLQGASFVINNPQATTTCGCGSSFAV